MDKIVNLPFKVGDLAEERTFEDGYRGAWFRCKIRDLCRRGESIEHLSEYYDFPDEEVKWTKLYKVPPYCSGETGERCRELMLRPLYPPIYRESQMPLVTEISEVTVIVDDTWVVGDLVDWRCTGCYWCGRIMQLFGDGEAKLALEPPPFGEGLDYEILLKDVRPTLNWSLECGWTVPTQDGNSGRACARIIKPLGQVESGQADEPNNTRTSNLPKQYPENNLSEAAEDAQDLQSDIPQKHRAERGLALDSTETDSLEAAIMDLEEIVNKVKRLKKILEHEFPFSDSSRPEWEFVDQCPTSAPK